MNNEQLVRNALACYADPARRADYFKLYAEDIVMHGYAGLEPGLENVKAFYNVLWAGFPDSVVHIDDLISAGDSIALRFTLTGTHQGSFQGIAATGRAISFSGMTFLRFVDGKCVERWSMADFPALMAQITAQAA